MKLLITSDTFTPGMDGPEFLAAGSLVEVDADSGRALANAGKALYIDPKDDPSARGNAPGTRTASAAQLEAAQAPKKQPAKADKADKA